MTSALTSPELSLAATMALKDISRDCTDSMKPSAEAVIASIQQSLQADRLNPGEGVRLMYPLGKMLSLLPATPIRGVRVFHIGNSRCTRAFRFCKIGYVCPR